MNKSVRRSRIGAAFTGITIGLWALFAPTAGATGHHRPVPRVVVSAMDACAPSPARTGQACLSLYLRPRLAGVVDGPVAVRECFAMAGEEHAAGTRRWGRYLHGCVVANLRTP